MAAKARPMVFKFFEVPENVDGNCKTKCKHCPAVISASSKATSNLLLQFSTTAATYDLNDMISHIVTDNAANMLKAFSLPGFETTVTNETWSDDDDDEDDDVTTAVSDDSLFEYVAHTLQLVIKDGFQQAGTINKVLVKASAVVSHVRKSMHATEMLENYKRLQTANATQWNLQLAMVRSILNIPDEKLRSLDTQHQFTAYDRNILKDLIEVLTPFKSATHCVQGDRVVTGSMVVPCVRILKTKLEALYNKFSSKFAHDVTPNGVITEVDDYLATPCLPEEADPLSFWKSHAEKYPSLAKLVPNYLCIPASSAPVERLFSIGGKIFRPDRCCRTDTNFENLMFLRCNDTSSWSCL